MPGLPSADITIREASMADYPAIAGLWSVCGLNVPWNDPQADLALALSNPESTVLVGIRGQEIIASVMVGQDGHRGWLYYLAVSPELQRQGIGRQMVGEAEKWLDGRGIPKAQLMVRTTNEKVVGFYQSVGYATSPVIVMQKWLKSPPSVDK